MEATLKIPCKLIQDDDKIEISFQGNKKNKIDEKLDKALNTPKRRKRK